MTRLGTAVRTQILSGVALLLLLAGGPLAHASADAFFQGQNRSADTVRPAAPAGDSVTMDQYRQLHKLRSERAMLTRILSAMNVVDSAYLAHYPTWIVRDEDIKQRVYKTFRNRLKFPPRDSALVIVSSPERDEIVRIIMGEEILGRGESRLYLGDELRRTILANDYPRTELEDVVEYKRPPELEPTVTSVIAEGSLFGGRVQAVNGWGFEARVGNDALGFPFWSSGTIDALLLVDRLKVGAVIPLNVGPGGSDIGPFALQGRKLDGAPGFTVQYQAPMFGGMLDLQFQNSSLTKVNPWYTLTSRQNFYFVRSMAQMSIIQPAFNINNEHFLSLSIGLGYDKIARAAMVDTTTEVRIISTINHVNPVLRINYQHIGNRTYGIGIQSYSSTVVVTAWIELLKEFIYLDAKYASPVFRSPRPWENSYFIMISPRIRLAF